jgi:hypothetical protein
MKSSPGGIDSFRHAAAACSYCSVYTAAPAAQAALLHFNTAHFLSINRFISAGKSSTESNFTYRTSLP